MYALIQSGIVVNIIEADREFAATIEGYDHVIEAQHGQANIGDQYVDGQFVQVRPAPVPESGPQLPDTNYLTQYAFDMRFTLMERVKIEQAAIVKDGMTEEQVVTALAIRVNLDRAKKAQYIDTTLEATRNGVMQFVQLGLLTEARAYEILDTPALEHEVYRGS